MLGESIGCMTPSLLIISAVGKEWSFKALSVSFVVGRMGALDTGVSVVWVGASRVGFTCW
jgi:hypothetical protein